MRWRACSAVLLVAVLLGACDSAGPEATPRPHFDLAVEAPVSASVEGEATLGSGLSFDDHNLFVSPLPGLNKTATIVQLAGAQGGSGTHDLSFLWLADGPLEPGSYEVGLGVGCDRPCGPGLPDELFTASYGRQTADSLQFYPLKEGTVTVETATDEVVEGTFSLDAAMEASVSRADMQAFRDSLRRRWGGPPSDTANVPRPPRPTVTSLEPPMTIEGRFTATTGTLSTEVTRPRWTLNGGLVVP